MKILLALFKWVLIITGFLVLCLAALVFFSSRQQDAAESKASDFCAQAKIGSDLSAPIARAGVITRGAMRSGMCSSFKAPRSTALTVFCRWAAAR